MLRPSLRFALRAIALLAIAFILIQASPSFAGTAWSKTLQTIQSRIEAQEYEASIANGALQAPNRAQGFRARYLADRLEIVPRTEGDWSCTWRTAGFGRLDALEPVAPTAPRATKTRVAHTRPLFIEWYENSPRGLEQGFTIQATPSGAGPLRIEGELGGTLAPRLRSDGDGIELFEPHSTAPVLVYEQLIAVDAAGRTLPSHMELAGRTLSLVVDDADASYPIIIDPLIYNSTRHGETGQSFFGISVSTAGDVNNDGFSDCIVGAYDYDGGETDEGKIYVYYGSPTGIPADASWTAEANVANSFLGVAVSSAGDVNGDGFHDILIGASGTALTSGKVYVWLGGVSGLGASGTAANADWSATGGSGAFFGGAASTAGDVNNDGYDDILVGASNDANGQAGEGRAFLWLGGAPGMFDPAGLGPLGTTANADWRAESDQAGAALASSLACAGDVNGDAYDDVIIGARMYDTQNGRAFVWHGGAADLGADGTPVNADWNMFAFVDSRFGDSVSGAGDVNGDGYADVVVGAPLYTNGQPNEGWFGIYTGSAGGLSLLPPWFVESNNAGAMLGDAVATAGDVNGDGFADIIAGAPIADGVPSGTDVGRAFVYEGSASGIGAVAVAIGQGTQTSSNYGGAVATAGDVDGDGYSEVLIGAPFHDEDDTNDGMVELWKGGPAGLAATPAWTTQSNSIGANLGWSLASAGDVNGDGYSDVLVGLPHYDAGQVDEGVAFLFLGTATGPGTGVAWSAQSNQANARFAWSVSGAGDVNGDGYDDVVIGARDYVNAAVEGGGAFVWQGSAAGLGADGTPANADWSYFGTEADARVGFAVSNAGDVNGDGYGDVVIGAPFTDTIVQAPGEAYVFQGSSGGLASPASWSAVSDHLISDFGYSVAGAGDVNRDGFGDLLVGARTYTDDAIAQSNEGWAFLWQGSASGLGANGTPASADWSAEGDEAQARLGECVASAGDVNADGYSDVIVGAPGNAGGSLNEGSARLWLGGPSGLAAGSIWQSEGSAASEQYGRSVDSCGDVNGDGYGDVVIGAPYFSNGETQEGRAVVYLGTATGLEVTVHRSIEGNQDSSRLGFSVASGGDVNGDGRSDLLVGAPYYENGQANEGHAFCHLGGGVDALDVIPRQMRAVGTDPIALLGASDAATSFQMRLRGRTPAGRGRVKIQVEIERYEADFDATGLSTGLYVTTAAPVAGMGSVVDLQRFASGLDSGTFYRWRARTLTDSPYFPRSPWFAKAGNAVTETDLRTGGPLVTDAPVVAQTSPSGLGTCAPNPFREATTIRFALPVDGRVRLDIVDVTGRIVATLVDEPRSTGSHDATWDGRNDAGARVASGVYFARLAHGSEVAMRKVLRLR